MRYECGREFCSHASNNVSEDRSSNSKQAATNRVHESAGTAGRQAAKVLWKNKERDKRTSAATVVCAAEQQQRGVQPGETIRPSPQYCANVCLKINMKLGGLTSVVNAQETNLPRVCSAPTIVIGADVTHPGVQETNRPSIAAVVASVDRNFGRYQAMVAQQPARMEIIQDLKGMLITLLNSCRTGIKAVPMQVVFYRDGVSEGQFNEVMAHEVKAINEAYAHYNSALKPKITFVIVAKRHHTRLFPANNEAAERTGNCLPGTVVDTTIVHPHRFDFYLQSHSGLQGTAKPLLYTVLRDDIGFTPDDLQSVSFSLCHMYSIATKSVSLVTPAYFAHRVAFRARSHTSESWSFDASDTASSISGSDSSHPFTHESKLLPVHPNLRHHMYFM